MRIDDPAGGDDVWEVDESLPLSPPAAPRGSTCRTLVDVAARLAAFYRPEIERAYRGAPSHPSRVLLRTPRGTTEDPGEPADFAEAMRREDASEADLAFMRAEAVPLPHDAASWPPGRLQVTVVPRAGHADLTGGRRA